MTREEQIRQAGPRMKTITIEIPEGKKAEWVDGVLTLVDEHPKDITERIKTFEDACRWCTENGYFNLRREYDCIATDSLILDEPTKDLIAYLKLRIITCALNEGWEPTFDGDEDRWYAVIPDYGKNNKMETFFRWQSDLGLNQSSRLFLKAKALAEYAATQFRDIYMDFCYKGKE